MTSLDVPLRVSAGVRHANIDHLRVILDLDRASYRVLDHVASAMWSVLLGERPQADVVRELTDAYDVPAAVLERDLADFGRRCLAEGLLLAPLDRPHELHASERAGERGEPSRRGRRVGWHWLAALRALIATNRSIDRDGLRAVYELAAAVPLGAPRVAFARAVAAFLAAEHVYVSPRAPDDCLGRSLALYAYLRAAGFAAVHVIGVRRIPFRAHAWVEYEGEVVLDRPIKVYVPLARLDGEAAPARSA